MNGSFLTAEVESLIQGYVEGELTASECTRLRELLEDSPDLITSILASLQTDASIRHAVLETANAGFESPPGHDFARDDRLAEVLPKRKRPARCAIGFAFAACLVAMAALGMALLGLRKSPRSAAPQFPPGVTGSILYERWADIPGASVRDLTTHPRFQQSPTDQKLLLNFEAASDQSENYGARIRGYLHPPVSGDYLFWITSDDAGELWLSENEKPATKKRICFVQSWTPPGQWTAQPSQQSLPIQLKAGGSYYIEALHKQGNADASIAVAWQAPGGPQEIIPGRVLSPFVQININAVRGRP